MERANHPSANHYQVRVRGHLESRWAKQFEGLALTLEPAGITLIEGSLEDQAALHSVLRRIRDLGLELVSVSRGPPSTNNAPAHHRHPTATGDFENDCSNQGS
ncbi:MAG: hypothetical protein AB7J35_18710 [Dehalococcoidia bacterium]